MKRKDCIYCIDLDEQGALCDHPLRLDCGEPVEARCSSGCADYERRISIVEALSRIHDLEARLAESEEYRAGYADMVIRLKTENVKLRELADAVKEFVEDTHCEDCPCRRDCNDNNRIFCLEDFSYHAFAAMRKLGIGV